MHTIKNEKVAHLLTQGSYVCIELPKKTFFIIWETQMFFVYLPFRCFTKMFHLIFSVISKKFQNKEKKLLKSIICCELDEKEKVLNAFHDFQTSSLSAVNKINTNLKRKRHTCSNYNEIRNSQATIFKTTKEECTSNNLESRQNLKSSKSTGHGSQNKADLLKKKCNVSSQTLFGTELENCAHGQLIELSFRNFLQSHFDKLRKQEEEYLEVKNCSPDVINNDSSHSRLEAHASEVLSNYKSNESPTKLCRQEKEYLEVKNHCPDVINSNSNRPYVEVSISDVSINRKSNSTPEKLQTLTRILKAENFELKEHLNFTTSQLNDIRMTTLHLDKKFAGLEVQLNEIKGVLHEVLTDRSTMQKKLCILQQMIEEEEIYLNDDSSREESCSSRLFINTPDCSTRNTSPIECCEIDFEKLNE